MSNLIDKYLLLEDQEILLEHEGLVNKDVLLETLPKIETLVDGKGVVKFIKRKIVNIAIETLQNLQLHSYPIEKASIKMLPHFLLTADEENISIIIGNLVGSDDFPILKDKLDKINSLNEQEIKYLYGVIMKQTVVKFSTKGGAGLGLIDMKKKSGNDLKYNFQKVDDNTTYFSLKITVPQR